MRQERRIIKIYKKFVDSNSLSKETLRHLKPVATRPGIMYDSCTFHKKCVDSCLLFRPILSGLQTPTYKLARFAVPILDLLTTRKYTVKDLFNFPTEIVPQGSSNLLGSLDVDSLFNNIHLEDHHLLRITFLLRNLNNISFLYFSNKGGVFYIYQEKPEMLLISSTIKVQHSSFTLKYKKVFLNNCV